MSIDRTQWITAREAAQRLRVTERMIGHYAADGKLRTYRAGRRVWYSVADVDALASSLRADLRIAPVSQQDVNNEALQSLRNFSEAQERFAEEQRRQGARQEDIYNRLERIEAQTKPRGPTWQQVIIVAVVLLIIGGIILAYLLR